MYLQCIVCIDVLAHWTTIHSEGYLTSRDQVWNWHWIMYEPCPAYIWVIFRRKSAVCLYFCKMGCSLFTFLKHHSCLFTFLNNWQLLVISYLDHIYLRKITTAYIFWSISCFFTFVKHWQFFVYISEKAICLHFGTICVRWTCLNCWRFWIKDGFIGCWESKLGMSLIILDGLWLLSFGLVKLLVVTLVGWGRHGCWLKK